MTSSKNITKDYINLKAGNLSVGYKNGFVRYIRYGDTEVIRNIYMALRDQNWQTYEHTIERESIERSDNHFQIEYDCFYQSEGNRIFEWNVKIIGDEFGKISFEINGKAIADVLKNRAGICVLHPLQFTTGNECELIHPDGTKSTSTFPVLISGDNPFKDLTGFRWLCRNNWYALQFEGDIFETEDQRNWCDASYKTFCTPLSKPFPVLLKAGETVHQKVTFTAETSLKYISYDGDQPVEIVAHDTSRPLPRIGIAASTEVEKLTPETISALRKLALSHYRIEIHPSQPDWKDKFEQDKTNAEALALPLEVALHAGSELDIHAFCNNASVLKARITNIILLSATDFATTQWLCEIAPKLHESFPDAKVGGGTDHNYRELNCNPFDATPFEFISFSVDPQEHATDDLTIIENMEAIKNTVHSAGSMYQKPVHVSSLTLKKRFNPAATVVADRELSNKQKSDPRQSTTFTAAFTLGSIKALSEAGATSVTLYQTVGTQGIISVDGQPYPVYNLLREILAEKGSQVITSESNRPLECDAVLLSTSGTLKILLVNYTESPRSAVFRNKKFDLAPHEIMIVTAN